MLVNFIHIELEQHHSRLDKLIVKSCFIIDYNFSDL